jgi:malonate-semialdehyde dehydrogenase (acetylating) / methylmalonate-semialdehyde dehydrogenase
MKNYINGEWVDSTGKERVEIRDPGTGQIIGYTPLSPAADINAAVAAADAAFWEWRTTPAVQRARYFFRIKEVLEENFEEIAIVTATEAGKTMDESRGELRRAIEMVEVACGIPSLMMGKNLEDIARNIDSVAKRQPIGVFAGIAPYNFPAMVPFWFWPFALATGNTYLLKPSEQDPMTQQMIMELLDEEVGLPPGVLNMVHGGKETVEAILTNDKIEGVSFVGSSNVARIVYKGCGDTGKRAQCLGGAKNFLVVMDDAILDKAIPNIIASSYGCAGQRCLAASTLIAVGDAYEPLKKGIVEAAKKLKVGYFADESVQMGPLISKAHKERVLNYIEIGIKEGADLIVDGRGHVVKGNEEGFFVGPTVFDNVKPEMVIANEEIFGPVLGIMKVDTLDEAIKIIQNNEYGNATSIYTQSGKSAREFTYRAECSMMGINIGIAAPMAFFPFGGAKGSFFGDTKAHGSEVVDFFTDKKVVIERWL